MTRLATALTLAIVLVALAAAGGGALVVTADNASAAKPALKRFGSCARVGAYIRKHADSAMPMTMPLEDFALEGAPGAAAPTPATGGGPDEGDSQTNVQEAGIDEPDIVKSNGEIVFAIARGRLHAIDATGATPVVLGTLRLPEGPGEHADAYDEQLLLSADRALVISRAYSASAPWERTIITEVEVADPAVMSATRTMRVEGSFVSARLAGQTARVVVSAAAGPPIGPVAVRAEEASQRAPARIRPGWMPSVAIRDREAGTLDRRRLVRCDEIGRPRRFSGLGLLTVLTIDLARGLPAIDSDAVMTGGETVYASPEALYVATERWLGPDAETGQESQVSTLIHKFDTSTADATEYRASGRVPGFMLNQWSMSERDGLLRVASTSSPPWAGPVQDGESESYVTVLGEADRTLREVGQVGGLGRGERIYAVRFFDEVGFVVTFREVDPLYAVDLSDPSDPRKVGELKVPGYSAYLHPVSEELLLGVGQDASEDGVARGVQVSLFDVSDLSDPARVDRWSAGRRTYTEVEYDHHSFLHWPPSGLAVFPLEVWGYERPRFTGAVGLRVGDGALGDGIEEVGRLAHGRGWRAAVRRSLVVDGRLLAISDRAVTTHDPATLAELGRTALGG